MAKNQRRKVITVNPPKVWIKSLASMNIFDSPYYRINQNLLRFVGLWPYVSEKKIISNLWVVFGLAFLTPHIIGILVHRLVLDRLIEHLVTTFIIIGLICKHFTLAIAEKKMKSVFNDISNNWSMIIDEEEKRILVEYSKRGRMFTIIYVCLLVGSTVTFLATPLLPEILNVMDPLPVPRAHIYVLQGYFFVDKDKHYFKIYFWDVANVIFMGIISMTIDSMYIVIVEHATALCAIVTHRLSKLQYRIHWDSKNGTDSSYEWVVHTVKLHQVTLRFASNINDSYSTCFFCLITLNLIGLPFMCIIVLVYWNDNNPTECSRNVSVLFSLMLHLFVLFWPGQKLINHSAKLAQDAYCNEWYKMPLRTRKILQIFMLRCLKPCMITPGGWKEINFETYFKVVKTAASYITVLASFRKN